jgi:hypothetical protein
MREELLKEAKHIEEESAKTLKMLEDTLKY